MDFRFALRSLWKNPGFTALAVVVMGLGIGANTAVFSVVNSVLLRPLAFREPQRIVSIANQWSNGRGRGQVSAPDFRDWHDQSRGFSAMAYYSNAETAIIAGGAAEYARFAAVTSEFLDVFGETPVIGRWFSAEETAPRSAGAAVISYAFWMSHYGGDREVLGRTIKVSGRALPIVGVLPAGFDFPDRTAIWYPTNPISRDTTSRSAHNYVVVARLKPDVPLSQAQAEMSGIAGRLSQQYPASNQGKGAGVAPMLDAIVGDLRGTLYLLLGAVALVLLIACSNVANLLLAKATGRTREIAIRAAIGASRGRIVRLLITESLVLSIASGIVGVLMALWGSSALVALAPSNIPRLSQTSVDARVLVFTFAISVLASLIFGLAPALQASRVDLNHALKLGAARSKGSTTRIRSALVVAEIALSVVLLSGAGLLMKSFIALHNVALGFRPEKLLVMSTSVPASNPEAIQRAMQFYEQLISETSSMPGVIAAGASRTPPGRIMSNGGYWVDHTPTSAELNINSKQAVFSIMTPGTIAALGIPFKAGRDFDPRDTIDAPNVAIINESLAKKSFPGQNPIGHPIFWGFSDPKTPLTIVGVVGDIRQGGPATAPRPEIYAPFRQFPQASLSMRVLVRTAGDPTSLSDAIRQKTRELYPDVPVRFTTMEASLAENVATPRFQMVLFGIFAGLAVSLAMAGVYGVMAYLVGLRASEIGLRMALGANPGSILGLVMKQGVRLAAVGLAIGLAAAVAASTLLTKLLFEVKPTDPSTYAAVALLLAAVALGACYFPARRAMRVDPLIALRQE